MSRAKEPPPEPKDDPFIAKVQQAMSDLLDKELEPKDLNALFANCIKFLMVKHKIAGETDGGEFFGSD